MTITVGATWDFAHRALLQCQEQAHLKYKLSRDSNIARSAAINDIIPFMMSAIAVVEAEPTVVTVGSNGRPHQDGLVQQDAAIMYFPAGGSDGAKEKPLLGAVLGVEFQGSILKDQILGESIVAAAHSVALNQTKKHTILVNEGAAQYIKCKESHYTDSWELTRQYFPSDTSITPAALLLEKRESPHNSGSLPHDTVGMVGIYQKASTEPGDETMSRTCNQVFAAVSTSGMAGKHPGRVGDSALFGSGIYAEDGVGAATCTGDGDVIATFPLSYVVIQCVKEELKEKRSPSAVNAAEENIVSRACTKALGIFLALPQVQALPVPPEVGVVCVAYTSCEVQSGVVVGGAASPAWRQTYNYSAVSINAGDGSLLSQQLNYPGTQGSRPNDTNDYPKQTS